MIDELICDACGETFNTDLDDDDDPVPLDEIVEEAEAHGWIEDGTYCPKHKGCHPDHVEINYGHPALE